MHKINGHIRSREETYLYLTFRGRDEHDVMQLDITMNK